MVVFSKYISYYTWSNENVEFPSLFNILKAHKYTNWVTVIQRLLGERISIHYRQAAVMSYPSQTVTVARKADIMNPSTCK